MDILTNFDVSSLNLEDSPLKDVIGELKEAADFDLKRPFKEGLSKKVSKVKVRKKKKDSKKSEEKERKLRKERVVGKKDISDVLEEGSEEEDELDEISDAILEIAKEGKVESKILSQRASYDAKDRMMYNLIQPMHQGLDYSKLHYGKVAEPLNVDYAYTGYEQDEENSVSSEQTMSMEEVEEIIEEIDMADRLSISSNFSKAFTNESFQYYKLFNAALIQMKYDPNKSKNTSIENR